MLDTEALFAGFTPDIGFLDEITPADPAAGANLVIPRGQERWLQILAVRFTITTSSAVANRFVAVDILGRGNVRAWRFGATAVITASTTAQEFQFDCAHTVSEWNTNTPIFAPLYPVTLDAGWSAQITVDNIDTADQLNSVRCIVRRFFADGIAGNRSNADY